LGGNEVGEGSEEAEGNSAVTGRTLREDPARERAGLSDRAGRTAGADAGKQRKLEELVLECVVALPNRTRSLLEQLPEDFFEDPVTSELARRIGDRAREDAFSSSALVHELEDTEAADLLLWMIGRVGNVEDDPLTDYEGIWIRVQRDIWRSRRQRRAEELKEMMKQEAAQRGDTERLLGLQREYFETLKELKRGSV
jgi:hypothetical protein